MQYFNYNRGYDYGGQQQQYQISPSESISTVPSVLHINGSNEKQFPYKYVAAHAVSFVLINVAVIIVQIGMSLNQAVFNSVGIGYWVY